MALPNKAMDAGTLLTPSYGSSARSPSLTGDGVSLTPRSLSPLRYSSPSSCSLPPKRQSALDARVRELASRESAVAAAELLVARQKEEAGELWKKSDRRRRKLDELQNERDAAVKEAERRLRTIDAAKGGETRLAELDRDITAWEERAARIRTEVVEKEKLAQWENQLRERENHAVGLEKQKADLEPLAGTVNGLLELANVQPTQNEQWKTHLKQWLDRAREDLSRANDIRQAQAELEESRSQVRKDQESVARRQGDLAVSEANMAHLSNLRDSLRQLESGLTARETDLIGREERIAKLERRTEAVTSETKARQSLLDEREKAMARLQSDLNTQSASVEAAREETQAIQRTREARERAHSVKEQELQFRETTLDIREKTVQRREHEISRLSNMRAELDAEVQQFEKRLSHTRQAESQWKKKYDQLRTSHRSLQGRCQELLRDLEQMRRPSPVIPQATAYPPTPPTVHTPFNGSIDLDLQTNVPLRPEPDPVAIPERQAPATPTNVGKRPQERPAVVQDPIPRESSNKGNASDQGVTEASSSSPRPTIRRASADKKQLTEDQEWWRKHTADVVQAFRKRAESDGSESPGLAATRLILGELLALSESLMSQIRRVQNLQDSDLFGIELAKNTHQQWKFQAHQQFTFAVEHHDKLAKHSVGPEGPPSRPISSDTKVPRATASGRTRSESRLRSSNSGASSGAQEFDYLRQALRSNSGTNHGRDMFDRLDRALVHSSKQDETSLSSNSEDTRKVSEMSVESRRKELQLRVHELAVEGALASDISLREHARAKLASTKRQLADLDSTFKVTASV